MIKAFSAFSIVALVFSIAALAAWSGIGYVVYLLLRHFGVIG